MSSGAIEFSADGSSTDGVTSATTRAGGDLSPFEMELARLIVSSLSLEMKPEDIPPEAPLFGEGLGLDSIDALELSLAVSKAYGVKLRSEDQRKYGVLASLRGLAIHIEKQRKA
jgi:acyl carrier protein